LEIELLINKGTPTFIVKSPSEIWARVYGAVQDKNKSYWLFPAYQPFLDKVLHDLEVVYSGCTFAPSAQAWLAQQRSLEEIKQEVFEYKFPVKSLDHQLQGTAEVIYNYRWLLKWAMGTGKSKAYIDAATILQCKTVVLAPRIASKNWVNEVEKHTGGARTAFAISDDFKRKLNKAAAGNYDFIIVTYGQVRQSGTPKIFPSVRLLSKKKGRPLHEALRNILMKVNDQGVQTRLLLERIGGRSLKEIQEEVVELTTGKIQWLSQLPFECIVADESHRIKHIQSLQTSACLDLARFSKRRVLLTGTLSQGDPRDLYPQLNFLSPTLLRTSYRDFCKKHIVYLDAYNGEKAKIPKEFKNLHALNRIVSSISSEKKLEDCVDLPTRQFIRIPFELSPAQKRDYNQVVKEWVITVPDKEDFNIANGAIRISKLLQLCSGFVYLPDAMDVCNTCKYVLDCVEHRIRPGTTKCFMRDYVPKETTQALKYPDNPKLDALKDLLEDLLMCGKVIIWAHLREELDDIENALNKNKIGYVRVDGKSTNKIDALQQKFNTVPACRVYLGQISTGIAITLNAAKYTVYYSRNYSLEDRLQTEGRNYRIGQDQKTVIYDLYAERSVELQQIIALTNKVNTSNLLTARQNCNLCAKYAECVQNETLPWSANCVLKTHVARQITKAWEIK
jgi:SNF2 family DNA or RNA helicase